MLRIRKSELGNLSRREFLEYTARFIPLGLMGSLVSCKNDFSSSSSNPSHKTPKKNPIPSKGYFIDQKNGDDKNSGTKENPWKTISKANTSVRPGNTVFIRKGEYMETISPEKLGFGDAPIIYQNFPGETPTIRGKKGSIAAVDLRGKLYVEVRGINIARPLRRYADLTGASYCTLEDILMDKINKEQGVTLGSYGTPENVETSYNKILGCEIHGYPKYTGDVALETLSIFGGNKVHSNLVENCEIIDADHVAINLKGAGHPNKAIGPNHNIIRLCTISNPLHHSLQEGYGAHSNLYELNHILQSGDGKSPENDGEGVHLAPLNSIFRFNTIESSGSTDSSRLESGIGLSWNKLREKFYFAGNNKFYNNDIVDNRGSGIGISVGITPEDCHQFQDSLILGSEFLNNIITGNAETLKGNYKGAEIVYRFWQSKECIKRQGHKESSMPKDTYRSNNIGRYQGQRVIRVEWPELHGFYSLEEASEILPLKFKDNFSGRVTEANKGDFLTFAKNSAVESRELKVNDARYFIAPSDWEMADKIQIGEQISEIESIDYKKNIIYLEKTLTWNEKDGVSLPFSGTRPNIGAIEF